LRKSFEGDEEKVDVNVERDEVDCVIADDVVDVDNVYESDIEDGEVNEGVTLRMK